MATCSGCAYEAAPGFAFCPRCGSRLPASCATCGRASEPDFAFCPHCGTPRATQPPAPASAPPRHPAPAVANAAGEAGRRHGTVLFVDLSGFTSLAEGFDPEVGHAEFLKMRPA